MLSKTERDAVIALIKREVVPAIGCTEPIAVALCVARACELLGSRPEKIEVRLSANILKNAMGVGIPGTGMIGLPIAIALGALVGRSEYGLEVLKDADAEAVEQGKKYIAEKRISVDLKKNIEEKLYIEAEVSGGAHRATAVIAGGHTNFVYLRLDDEVIEDSRTDGGESEGDDEVHLTLRRVYDFAMTTPTDDLKFILEARRLNKSAAEQAFRTDYGHSLGKTLRGEREIKLLGDSIFSRIISYTAAACDARMAGAMIPVMSNSGSGNQGITGDPARGGLRRGVRSDGGANDSGVDAQPSDGDIHQAESGPPIGVVRLRRRSLGIELRHNLSYGRRLRRDRHGRQKHDRQPDGHDLRRRQTQLRA